MADFQSFAGNPHPIVKLEEEWNELCKHNIDSYFEWTCIYCNSINNEKNERCLLCSAPQQGDSS